MIKNFENRVITGLKDNIQMTIENGNLAVLNLVRFTLSEEGKESSGFFEDISAKEDSVDCILPIIVTNKGYEIKVTDWLSTDKSKLNIDKYPEEMQPAIAKSVNSNKGVLSSVDKGILIVNNLNIVDDKFLEASIAISTKAYESLMMDIKKYKVAGMADNIEGFIERYMFKKHVLIQGEKGGGKTYGVHKKLEEEGLSYLEIDGHEGIESIDLLGYPIKDLSGNFVWQDGVLTEAFRKAQTEKVVLFIDELLRIPKKEQNIFVGSLTPMSDKTYTLRTGRLIGVDENGIGKTEYIKVPMENLWVVSTTNVGAGYAVEEIDEAFSDRFRIMNKMTSESELESIILSVLRSKSYPENLSTKFMSFYKEMRDMVDGGELEKRINTRHICEIIELSDDVSSIKEYAGDLIPQWVTQDTDGRLNKTEIDVVNKLIKRHF